MARRLRVSAPGFYHVLNRGVAKGAIFFEEADYRKFLHIIEDAGQEYSFELYDFCLMANHYHLLLESREENISTLMQKIGSRYSSYINRKYERVGPLWQGRFKSCFVHNETYLNTLVRYIELNPVKAGLCTEVSRYPWAMSSRFFKSSVLNYQLIGSVGFDHDLTPQELELIEGMFKGGGKGDGKTGTSGERTFSEKLLPLSAYFDGVSNGGAGSTGGAGGGQIRGSRSRALDEAIMQAIRDGYSASSVAAWLGLSKAAVSKRTTKYKLYRPKVNG